MTQSDEPRRSLLAAALGGGKNRGKPRSADQAFDQEVDDELQREKFHELWEQYSGYVLAAAVAIVLGVLTYKIIESRRQTAADAAGAAYLAAIKLLGDGKTDEATQRLAAIGKTRSGFATLARLRLAAAAVAAQKPADAIAQYDALSKDRGIDPIFSDYARLQSAMLSLDTASWDDMQTRLAELTAEGNVWRYPARELLGMAALKAGKTNEARAQFEKLVSDPGVSPGMAERARIVMGSIVAAELAVKGPPGGLVAPSNPAVQSGPGQTPPGQTPPGQTSPGKP